MAVRHRDRTWQCHWKLWVTPGSGLTHRMYSLQFFFWATRHGRFKKHMLMQASWFALALGKWIFPSSTLLKLTTRYTPHRRPRRFGHFLQLALTFVHQHFLQGTSVYLRFVPFFQCFRRRCSAVKNWVGDMGPWCCRQAHWNTSSKTIGERTVCNNVCTVQGTLTCPTPPQPLLHILAVAEHQ